MAAPLPNLATGKWYPWATLTEGNRRRPLAWRWLRARQIVSTGQQHGGRFEDPMVNRACTLLRIQNDEAGLATIGEIAARRAAPATVRSEDLTEEDRIKSELPDLHDAHLLYTGEDMTTRWQIEAMILAGEDTQYIADQTSNSPKTIGVYEQLFFDVRDRLQASAFIAGQVLDTAARHDLPVGDPDKWWKVLGYQGYRLKIGAGLLEAFWDFDIMPDNVRDWYYRVVESNLAKQSAAFTATIRLNPEIANFFVQNYWTARKLQMEQKRLESATGGAGDDTQSKQALLESMSMTVASVVGGGPGRATEPRAQEQLSAELEQVGVQVADSMANAKQQEENQEESD